jgi:hypothetical protein
VKFRIIKDLITPSLSRIEDQLDKIPEEAYREWQSLTPKRSGNARKKTKLSGNTINAAYQYADVLDKGSSRQAPQGMSKPVSKFITRKIKSILRK